MPRTRGRNNRRRPARIPTNVKQSLDGRHFRPPPDPRSITQVPWNSLTLSAELAVTNSALVTIKEVHAQVCDQIGLAATTQIFYRFLTIAAWNLSGAPIAMTIYDLFSLAEGNYLANLEDFPGRNQWARVGYHYAAAQSQRALYSNVTTPPSLFAVRVQAAPASQAIFVRAQLLWKVFVTRPPAQRGILCTPGASTMGFSPSVSEFDEVNDSP